jgi:hypothetical protein
MSQLVGEVLQPFRVGYFSTIDDQMLAIEKRKLDFSPLFSFICLAP